MIDDDGVPAGLLRDVRAICLDLPETYEEPAWVGTRWRIRQRTFAHVLHVEDGRPQGHARVVGSDGPLNVLTFRSSGPELAALRHLGPPYFGPPWRGDEVLMVLGGDVHWDEVAELLVESYCLLAPQKLVAAVARPAGLTG